MNNNILSINGTLWGDEGKGKATDYFASKADIVVRSQGGNNAGHTIVFGGKKYSLRLLPSGIYNKNITNVLANGMVIDVEFLISEIALVKKEVKAIKLLVSDRAHIVFPYHKELDQMWEDQKEDKIGTTKKGIGPTYADKSSRVGIRMGDLLDEQTLANKLKFNIEITNKMFKAFNYNYQSDFKQMFAKYQKIAKELKQYISNTSEFLNDSIKQNKKILFEGAQGAMLCLDHGTYPMVTSSSPTPLSIPLNTGVAPKYFTNVLGITKAYTTRVGEGPFATEFDNEVSNIIREVGHEYGTVTSRPRRIGWLDGFVLNYAIKTTGVSHIAIMLLDVLSGIQTLKIATGYTLKGKKITSFPSQIKDLEKCEATYVELKGWKEDISNIKDFKDLPNNAKEYIYKIEKITGAKVAMVSVGPDRVQTIMKEKIF